MSAIRPLPPPEIRRLMEKNGFEVVGEDLHNWAFASRADEAPIIIPFNVDLVPLEIAFHVAQLVGFNEYFASLREQPHDPWQQNQPSPGGPVDPA